MNRPPRFGRAAALLALAGFTLGPVYDSIHTYSGATWYPAPQLLRNVWWCPPLFAAAAVAIGMPRLLQDTRIYRDPRPPGNRALAGAFAIFTAAYLASGWLPVHWAALTVLITLAFLVSAVAFDSLPRALPGALGAALGGWLVEWNLTRNGLFGHRDQQLGTVAAWIPPLYACASVAVGALARRLGFAPTTAPSERPSPSAEPASASEALTSG
jgi:hypothetical protein